MLEEFKMGSGENSLKQEGPPPVSIICETLTCAPLQHYQPLIFFNVTEEIKLRDKSSVTFITEFDL